jgi:hypothetical protein
MVKKLSHAHDFTGCPLKIETNTWQCGRIPRNPGGALVQNAIQMIVLHSSNNAGKNKQKENRSQSGGFPVIITQHAAYSSSVLNLAMGFFHFNTRLNQPILQALMVSLCALTKARWAYDAEYRIEPEALPRIFNALSAINRSYRSYKHLVLCEFCWWKTTE